MNRIWRPVLGALLAAALPAAAAAQDNDAAELAEARAIVAVIYPPADRDAMMRTMLEQFAGQVRQSVPLDVAAFGDPGLSAIVEKFQDNVVGLVMPTVQAHLPKIIEATAVAYTHEFDLAELRDIRAFAETPAGRRYLSRQTALVGDPAVAEVNTAYLRDIQLLAASKQAEFREELLAYFAKHPEVARKVAEASAGQ
jgi:hypothetical protein